MTVRAGVVRAGVVRAALGAGLLGLAVPLAACGADESAVEPQPTGVSIAPPSTAPTTDASESPSAPPSNTPSKPPSKPPSSPSIARSEQVTTITDAVAVAEGTVADSAAVEASKDDDGQLVWEVTVRAGDNGRELRISGADGSVLSNESDRLDQSQLGAVPKVDIRDALEVAEKAVTDGVATDVELSRENGTQVWEASVDDASNAEWELWIDASSGKVIHKERD